MPNTVDTLQHRPNLEDDDLFAVWTALGDLRNTTLEDIKTFIEQNEEACTEGTVTIELVFKFEFDIIGDGSTTMFSFTHSQGVNRPIGFTLLDSGGDITSVNRVNFTDGVVSTEFLPAPLVGEDYKLKVAF